MLRKSTFLLLGITLVFYSCGNYYPEAFIVNEASHRNHKKVNFDSGYVYRLHNVEVKFPKEWKPINYRSFYIHTPFAQLPRDTVTESGAFVRVEVLTPKLGSSLKSLKTKILCIIIILYGVVI